MICTNFLFYEQYNNVMNMKDEIKVYLEKINKVEEMKNKIEKSQLPEAQKKNMIENCDNIILEKSKKLEDYLK